MKTVPLQDEVRLALRLPGSLHARLVELAKGDHRSLNSEIVFLLLQVSILAESRQKAERQLAQWDDGATP